MATIINLVLLLALVGFCGCHEPKPKRYLQTWFITEYNTHEFQWIFKRIDSGQWGHDADSIAASIRDAFATLRNVKLARPHEDRTGVLEYKPKAGQYSSLYPVLEYMNELASAKEANEIKCDGTKTRYFIDIANMKFGGSISKIKKSSEGLMFEFLKQYAFKYYARCLKQAEKMFEQNVARLRPDTELKLDTLVAMGAKFAPEDADEHLTDLAMQLDLAHGKYSATKMFHAVRDYINMPGKKGSLWSSKNSNYLYQFIYDTCKDVRSELVTPLDAYNLARILAPAAAAQQVMSAKFRKFNEYSRICIPFYYQTHVVKENVAWNMLTSGVRMMFKRQRE